MQACVVVVYIVTLYSLLNENDRTQNMFSPIHISTLFHFTCLLQNCSMVYRSASFCCISLLRNHLAKQYVIWVDRTLAF